MEDNGCSGVCEVTKWEFATVSLKRSGDRFGKELASLGQRGWDLVSVDGGIAYFKRSIPVTVNAVNPGSRAKSTAISEALREQGISLKQ